MPEAIPTPQLFSYEPVNVLLSLIPWELGFFVNQESYLTWTYIPSPLSWLVITSAQAPPCPGNLP